MTDHATTPAATGASPYHRQEGEYGHLCPNCSNSYAAEELLPVKVGAIVRVVSKQNRDEKTAAFELARSPQLLYDSDVDPMDVMPSALLNIKSPDWAELPPCIARYRVSLYQLRHSQKLMEKSTSLCEECYSSFFPGRELPLPRSPRSPNAGGAMPRPRGPRRGITFEEWLAQSRFPDRSSDMAFSVVGQCMRHAASEARAKQTLKDTINNALDSIDLGQMHTGGGGIGGDGGGGGGGSPLDARDAGGSIEWGGNTATQGGGQQLQTVTSPLFRDSGGSFPMSLAAEVAATIDPLPTSILDAPFSEWLARDLWDKLGDVMEFAHDDSMLTTDSDSDPVPSSHQFHQLYCHNKLRLPNPPGTSAGAPPVSRWEQPSRAEITSSSNPVDKSFARDKASARTLSVPDSLDEKEKKLFVEIMAMPREAREEARWDFSDLSWEVDEFCSA